MMRSILFHTLALLLLFSFHSAIAAEKTFCNKAEATSDLISCISDHLNAQNNRLNTLYTTVTNNNTDIAERIHDNQTDWITFRDNTCALRGTAYQGGSLQRIEELSCLVQMTDERIDALSIFERAEDDTIIEEYTDPPRWMNVLLHDHGNYFWELGSITAFDSDCDEIDEKIIRGMDQNGKMIIAIADSKKTGRPHISLVNLEKLNTQCLIESKVQLSQTVSASPDDVDEEKPLECPREIIIKTETCGTYDIQYDPANSEYNVIH